MENLSMAKKKKVYKRKSFATNITDSCISKWRHNKEQDQLARTEKKIGKAGHVFIVSLGRDGLYRIGHTYSIEKRLKALKKDYPFIKCAWSAWSLDMQALEKIICEQLKDNQVGDGIFRLEQRHIVNVNQVANQFR